MLGHLAITNGEDCSENNVRDIFGKLDPPKKLPWRHHEQCQISKHVSVIVPSQQTAIGFDSSLVHHSFSTWLWLPHTFGCLVPWFSQFLAPLLDSKRTRRFPPT
jgi:hypothetical protein